MANRKKTQTEVSPETQGTTSALREDVLLNVAQTAGMLGLSTETLRRMVERGEIAVAMRTPQGRPRFWLSEVYAYREGTLNAKKGQASEKSDGHKGKSKWPLQADREVSQP